MTKDQKKALEFMGQDIALMEHIRQTLEREITADGDLDIDRLDHLQASYEEVLGRTTGKLLQIRQEVGRVRTAGKRFDFQTAEHRDAFVGAGGDIPVHFAPGAADSLEGPTKPDRGWDTAD